MLKNDPTEALPVRALCRNKVLADFMNLRSSVLRLCAVGISILVNGPFITTGTVPEILYLDHSTK